MGKVYLIGAGPGSEELVTLKAIRVLKKCTAVLYDRLAGDNLLKYLSPNCKIFYCGKEPGAHYKTQKEINEMLILLADEGHIVGRIKGGDPYVFGRGGEEGIELYKKNIPFEVVPGITSAISVLSYAGIPVTHRGVSQSFHVFTGMSAEKLNIDWGAVSKLKGTLIFLMSLDQIEKITELLIDNGKSVTTPAAVIMKGTTASQRKVIGTLLDIANKARDASFRSPCIIVVGEVVSFTDKLNWYEKQPLFGLNVCNTRSKEQSAKLCEKLLSLGAEVTEINSIEIQNTSYNLDKYLNELLDYQFIIMSSVNSVNIFFDYLKKNLIDLRKLKAKFAVIGTATQKSLIDRGIMPEIIAEEFLQEGLVSELNKYVISGCKILIPGSQDSRKVIAQSLRRGGCIVDEVAIYKAVVGKLLSENLIKDIDVILFTSPSGVKNMIKLVGLDNIKSKTNLAIGPITQKALLEMGIDCVVSSTYTTDGMISKLLEVNNELNRVRRL